MSAVASSPTARVAPLDVAACRAQFPALSRERAGRPVVYLDGPAGSQVPLRVIEAVSHYYRTMNANHGGVFATSRESDAMLDEARRAVADLLGAADPDTVAFGGNMTTLTFGLSRALGKTWQPGDEVIVTRLDHDANVTPWVLAARDAGATVHHVDIRQEDCTLDLEDLRAKLSSRTKLVAVGCASNSVGTINPVKDICRWAREAGALTFLDAVHYAPHALLDVDAWGCDFLACSAYKFFGPHVGVLWGRRELLSELPVYKLRPVPNTIPDRWMTGTQSHESIAGVLAAVDYLAELGGTRENGGAAMSRRTALQNAFSRIDRYERELVTRLLAGLRELRAVRIWGITDPERMSDRVPTVAITHDRLSPQALAERLAEQGIFVWHGNYYALSLSEALGREPEGMVRIGLLHYNTSEEVERLLAALRQLP
ncbi:MAG: cysteine desulfurase-like protein [Pirellulales bacterium]|nr:cysteine desulfurase-like protein [Pirellulales bacterium]